MVLQELFLLFSVINLGQLYTTKLSYSSTHRDWCWQCLKDVEALGTAWTYITDMQLTTTMMLKHWPVLTGRVKADYKLKYLTTYVYLQDLISLVL